ncbi:MAG: hypothetical protein ABI665_22700, partial [Vicinamibacterales bacterium]
MRTQGAAFLIVATGLLIGAGGGPGSAPIIAAPALYYEEVKTWPALPAGVQMGEAAGVALDATGHVLVFHRPGRGFDT